MHEVDRIIEEAHDALSSYERDPRDIATVGYKGRVNILKVDYPALIREAAALRRNRIALNRAEAVEGAFDLLLHKATRGEWERTGEVHLDRDAERARAFCSSGGGTPQAVGQGNNPDDMSRV